MSAVNCSQCGSSAVLTEGHWILCAHCRTRFTTQSENGSRLGAVIDLQADIRELLQKCVDDPSNRRRYANLALDIDPTNRQAASYLN